MRFVAPTKTPKGLARRFPPAVFPSFLGLFGLGFAWREAADAFVLPRGIPEGFLGAVTLAFCVAFSAYMTKLARRPTVLMDDLRVLAGRLGVSAMVACLYLLATTLGPYNSDLARAILYASLPMHGGLIALLVWMFATGPAEARRYSPAGHLYFASPLIGSLAAIAVGDTTLAVLLLLPGLAVAVIVWVWGAVHLIRKGMPAPLRPLLALHLFPIAVAGFVANELGYQSWADVAAIDAAVLLGISALRATSLTRSGFSQFWAVFTYPLVMTASLWMAMGGTWRMVGGVALLGATFLTLKIAYGVFKMWAGGQLAIKTNAAIA